MLLLQVMMVNTRTEKRKNVSNETKNEPPKKNLKKNELLEAEVEKIFFFLRVCYQSQIFSANFYKFCQGFSLKDSINTKENGIFFNFLLEFTIIFEF